MSYSNYYENNNINAKSPKILSWDIGIINLAYCILAINEENKYDVYRWGLIDLLNDNTKSETCCQLYLKKGKEKICGKTASLYKKIKKDKFYYCKVHGKKLEKVKPYKFKKAKASDIPLIDLNSTLFKILDEMPDLLDVDIVILETQPTYNPNINNIKMKTLSNLLHSYFVIRGYNVIGSRIKQINFIHSKNALAVYNGPEIECEITDKYKRKKWMAVQHTKALLEGKEECLEFLDKNKKKDDDLADAFLNGGAYLRKFK